MADSRPDRGRSGGLARAPLGGDVQDRSGRGGMARQEPDDGPSEDDLEQFGGVTRKCPACGKEVYDDAEVCYHCGEVMALPEESPRAWIIVVVVLVVVALAGVLALKAF